MTKESVRGEADINGYAAKGTREAAVMVWNYHDDNVPAPDAPVTVQVKGLTASRVLVQHYRIDQRHSNSYEVWKGMGSPQKPTPEQIKLLEAAGQLQMLNSPEWMDVKKGELKMDFDLPRQGVSLIRVSW